MEIEWTEPAIKDLDAIYTYISTDSEFYASSFVEKIIEAVGKLKDFPEIGRIVSEADNPNVRELIFQNFRIIYRIITKGNLRHVFLPTNFSIKPKRITAWKS